MTAEHRLITALKQVKRELLIPAAEYVPAIPACWEIINAALAASPSVGGWEEPVGCAEREVGRAVYERIETLIGGDSAELDYLADLVASVEEYGSYSGPTNPLNAAPPPPSVSTDKGSRPQEAVPTEGHGVAVVGDDGWITHDGGPNPVPGQVVNWRNAHGDEETWLSDEVCGWERNVPYHIVAYRIAPPTR